MPAYVTETIVWTCVVAFMICMAAGLLVVTGKWEPRDPVVRKWLLRTVVFTAVGAVATFAALQFSGGGKVPESPPGANERKAPNGDPSRLRDADRGPQRIQPQPRRSDPQPQREVAPNEEIQSDAAVPEDVASWAEAELGTRPVFHPPATYPDCVGKLRSQETVSRRDARECRAELEQMHLSDIVGFYNVKGAYDTRLEDQEEKLRSGGISQDELSRYNYVVSEMERLNADGSAETAAVHELEGRLLKDILSCRRSLCQSLE